MDTPEPPRPRYGEGTQKLEPSMEHPNTIENTARDTSIWSIPKKHKQNVKPPRTSINILTKTALSGCEQAAGAVLELTPAAPQAPTSTSLRSAPPPSPLLRTPAKLVVGSEGWRGLLFDKKQPVLPTKNDPGTLSVGRGREGSGKPPILADQPRRRF